MKSEDPNGCWIWVANITSGGYGQISIGRKSDGKIPAHRLSLELATGRRVPKGLCVCHRCDVRACVNPAHLFVGTYRENLEDMRTKRRGARGTTNAKKKLSDEQVAIIRQLRGQGFSQNWVARRFGVNQALISRMDAKYWSKALAS